jgi:hypothetical protein
MGMFTRSRVCGLCTQLHCRGCTSSKFVKINLDQEEEKSEYFQLDTQRTCQTADFGESIKGRKVSGTFGANMTSYQ